MSTLFSLKETFYPVTIQFFSVKQQKTARHFCYVFTSNVSVFWPFETKFLEYFILITPNFSVDLSRNTPSAKFLIYCFYFIYYTFIV